MPKFKSTEKRMKTQSTFEATTRERISNISKTHSSLLEELESSMKEYTTRVKSLSEDQKVFFEAFLNDLKVRDEAIKADVSKNISELNELFQGHFKLNLEYLERLCKETEDSHTAYINHASSLKDNLKNISTETEHNFKTTIESVQSDADQRLVLQIERSEAMAAMMNAMKQMEAITVKEQAFNENMSSITKNLEAAKEKFVNDVEENVVKPIQSHTLGREVSRQAFHKAISNVNKLNESHKINSESKTNNSTKALTDIMSERDGLFQKMISSVAEKSECVKNELTSCTDMVSEKKEVSNRLIDHHCDDIQEVMGSECVRLKAYYTQTNAYIHSLSDDLQQYSSSHDISMKDCVDQLDAFQEKELQTYTPTGATPMKKEFKYPRKLACTSPHNTIIKRLREENEWSDLDATTIDEVGLLVIFCDLYRLSFLDFRTAKPPSTMFQTIPWS